VRRLFAIASLIALGTCTTALIARGGRADAASTSPDTATRDRIMRFVRERFGIAESVPMTAEPLRASAQNGFLETALTVGEGAQKRTQSVYLTKDRRFLVVGNLYTLGSDPKSEIAQHVRTQFKVPETTRLVVGPLRTSPFPNFQATTVTADDGKTQQTQEFFVTRDNRWLVLGTIFNLTADPRREALRAINTANQPSQGPTTAPVTVVQYSDLQCPSCARFHEFLEKELVPRYGGKVRVVFKEFPLVNIHEWSLAGSIAAQCVYQIDPASYVRYRSQIYQNQSSINGTNARDRLLTLGEQIGIDRLKLATCMDAKVTLARVEENYREGTKVGVQSTPTSFINGRMIVGLPSVEEFYKAVDEALRGAGR
jgi:protein-disulfide isomerase